MSEKKDLELKLMNTEYKEEEVTPSPTPDVTWNEFQYKQFGNSPKIELSALTLVILCPLLISAHVRVANLMHIPLVQFAFVTFLVAFVVNYTAIIRRYELMPFLPEQIYDYKLKKICVCAVLGIIFSLIWGWNGSAGILFAMIWQWTRGNKMDFYGFMLLIIIAGSLLMEENYTSTKLLQFIPGLLFGYCNTVLSTLRESAVYAIGHQFLFLGAVVLPMLFPGFHVVTPSIFQWIVMIIAGFTLLLTVMLTIKLMQMDRVSVVMGVLSGLMMIGTSSFGKVVDWIGAILIIGGVGLLVKKQHIDVHY